MKKIVLSIVFVVSAYSINVKAQVGINIASPSSTLDITAKNATGTSKSVDGLLVPRVDRERAQNMNGVPTSTLIFVNSIATGTQTGTAVNIDAVGHYSFDGTAWVKLVTGAGSGVNIYNSDGTLTGNRVVTQGANTLAFKGTAANAFSVDGTTLSVDAANHRVGVGTTTPENKFQVVSTASVNNRFSLFDAPESTNQFPIMALRNTSPLATGNYALLGFSNAGPTSGGANWGMGTVRTATAEEFFLGNSISGGTYTERLRVTSGGLVGIGTATPQKQLHVNGGLQITNELNVGGDGITAGSAGTIGQILTSSGPGAAPAWQAPASSLNIYNSDGTLTGNRIVTQGVNTLAFNGTAANAFSVDGTTFSVDAANDRVGLGTTAPAEKLDVRGGLTFTGQSVINKTAFGGIDNTAGGTVPTQTRVLSWGSDASTNGIISFWTGMGGAPTSEKMRIHSNGNVGIGTTTPNSKLDLGPIVGSSITDVAGKKLAVYNDAAGTDFYGLGISGGALQFHAASTATEAPAMVLTGGGSVGIGTTTPTSTLDVSGTARVRTIGIASGTTPVTPVYSDANGNLVKAASNTYLGVTSTASVSVASGATNTLISGLADGGVYRFVVTVGDGCAYNTVMEFFVSTYVANGNFAIRGLNGLLSAGTSKAPTITEPNRSTTVVTWTGKATCGDGANQTSLDYTLSMPNSSTINLTNNGNVTSNYVAVITRLN